MKTARDKLEEGNALWDKGERADAIARYKIAIEQESPTVEKSHGSLIYVRVIEYELEQKDIASARHYMQKAKKRSVALSFDHTDAQILYAEVTGEKVVLGKTTVAVKPTQPKGSPEQQKLEAKVNALKVKVTAIKEVIADVETEKQEVIDSLKKAGVRSTADLKNNASGQKYAARLQQLAQEKESMERIHADLEDALDKGKTVLSQLNRRLRLKQAGISDEDLADVSVTIAQIDEKLNVDGKRGSAAPADPLKLEAVLEKELKYDQQKKK